MHRDICDACLRKLTCKREIVNVARPACHHHNHYPQHKKCTYFQLCVYMGPEMFMKTSERVSLHYKWLGKGGRKFKELKSHPRRKLILFMDEVKAQSVGNVSCDDFSGEYNVV